jgi:putative membrane protein
LQVFTENEMLKVRMIKALLGAALVAAFAAQAQTMNTPAASALNKADQQIVAAMARANMAEIAVARLALANSQDAHVKAFAQQMVDDHTKALNDVTTLAQNKGVVLPAGPDAKHKALAARLSKLKGEQFDQVYMAQAGVADHKQVHAALTRDHARARDPDVKALAAKMLPTVEQHLQVAMSKPTVVSK